MDYIRLLCCGNSIENARCCLTKAVIGTAIKVNFAKDELVFIVVKYENDWNIIGAGYIDEPTNDNPFNPREKYKYVYKLTKVSFCKPFGITEETKMQLGERWGLLFQSPKKIYADEYISWIKSKYEKVDYNNWKLREVNDEV